MNSWRFGLKSWCPMVSSHQCSSLASFLPRLTYFSVGLNALSCIFVAEGRWRWRRRTTTPLRPLPPLPPNSTTTATVSRASSHSTTTPADPRNPTMTLTTTHPRPLLRRRPAVLTHRKSAAACAFTMSEAPSPSSYRCSPSLSLSHTTIARESLFPLSKLHALVWVSLPRNHFRFVNAVHSPCALGFQVTFYVYGENSVHSERSSAWVYGLRMATRRRGYVLTWPGTKLSIELLFSAISLKPELNLCVEGHGRKRNRLLCGCGVQISRNGNSSHLLWRPVSRMPSQLVVN